MAGAWEERIRIKMETYAWLRRRAHWGHPPGTACALPRTWDGGASGKSQLHRMAAGRSLQTSVGDARIEDRVVGDRTPSLVSAGPACCSAATVAPAAPRPAAKVPAGVAASQESAQEAVRVLPAGSHGPLCLLSFVIPRAWQGVFFGKIPKEGVMC